MTELPEGRYPPPGNARGTIPFVLVSYAAAVPVAIVILAQFLGFGAGIFDNPSWEDISLTLFIFGVLLGVLAVPIGAAVIVGHLVSSASRRAWVRFVAIAVIVSLVSAAAVAGFLSLNWRELVDTPWVLASILATGPALAAGAVAPWFVGFASPRRAFTATVVTTGADDTEAGRTPEGTARDV